MIAFAKAIVPAEVNALLGLAFVNQISKVNFVRELENVQALEERKVNVMAMAYVNLENVTVFPGSKNHFAIRQKDAL